MKRLARQQWGWVLCWARVNSRPPSGNQQKRPSQRKRTRNDDVVFHHTRGQHLLLALAGIKSESNQLPGLFFHCTTRCQFLNWAASTPAPA